MMQSKHQCLPIPEPGGHLEAAWVQMNKLAHFRCPCWCWILSGEPVNKALHELKATGNPLWPVYVLMQAHRGNLAGRLTDTMCWGHIEGGLAGIDGHAMT